MREHDRMGTNGADVFDRLEEQVHQINARLERISQALASKPAPLQLVHLQEHDLLTGPVDVDAVVEGFLVAEGDLRVTGRIKGNLLCGGTLFIGEEGLVQASVTASGVVVAGRLEGEVDCQGRFLVLPTGTVAAKVNTGTAEIQPGARVTGDLQVREIDDGHESSYQNGAHLNSAMLLQADPASGGQPALRDGSEAAPEAPGLPSMPVLTTERLHPHAETRSGVRQSVAYAQSVRAILSERARRSLQRLTRNGKRTGRPRVSDREGFQERFTSVLERLKRGELSHRGAARELSIGHATLLRLLRQRRLT